MSSPIQIALKACPGRTRVSDNRTWFVPQGKSASECTYCEECYYKHIRDNSMYAGIRFNSFSNLQGCNCDYDPNLLLLPANGVPLAVSIRHAKDRGLSFPVRVDRDQKRASPNQYQVVLPTCTPYVVRIDNLSVDGKTSSDTFSSGYSSDYYMNLGNWMTVEHAAVGSRTVEINHGERIFYHKQVELEGFATGGRESFFFISPSIREKAEGQRVDGENVTNVITLKLQLWTRRRRFPYANDVVAYASGNSGHGNYHDMFSSFGAPRSMGKAFALSPQSVAIANVTSHVYNGGATVSGGDSVPHKSTTTTDDRFERLGDAITVTIELVCDESDETRYAKNVDYRFGLDLQAYHSAAAKRSSIGSQLTAAEQTVQRLRDQLTTAEADVARLDHVTRDARFRASSV